MANDMPQIQIFTPGTWVDQDAELLLNLQLAASGLSRNPKHKNFASREELQRRLVPEFKPQDGLLCWKLDGNPILTFIRQGEKERELIYRLIIPALIKPVTQIQGVH